MYLNVGLEGRGEAVSGLGVVASVEMESGHQEVVERGRR